MAIFVYSEVERRVVSVVMVVVVVKKRSEKRRSEGIQSDRRLEYKSRRSTRRWGGSKRQSLRYILLFYSTPYIYYILFYSILHYSILLFILFYIYILFCIHTYTTVLVLCTRTVV